MRNTLFHLKRCLDQSTFQTCPCTFPSDLSLDLNIPTITREIKKCAGKHKERLHEHVNNEVLHLLNNADMRKELASIVSKKQNIRHYLPNHLNVGFVGILRKSNFRPLDSLGNKQIRLIRSPKNRLVEHDQFQYNYSIY